MNVVNKSFRNIVLKWSSGYKGKWKWDDATNMSLIIPFAGVGSGRSTADIVVLDETNMEFDLSDRSNDYYDGNFKFIKVN